MVIDLVNGINKWIFNDLNHNDTYQATMQCICTDGEQLIILKKNYRLKCRDIIILMGFKF